MAKPKVTIQGYTYLFEFEKEQVTLYFDRLHDESKATKGEIWVSSTSPANKGHIHHTRFDLTSTTQKKALVKQLEERWKDESWDWGDLIEQCSISVLGHFRKGEPIIAIQADVTKIAPPEYVIYPLLPRLQPTIIFGQGGVGKSAFAQLLALHVLTAWHDNPFGFRVGIPEPRPVLYLDWETDDKNIAYTFTKLKNGLGRPDCTMHYRRCAQPFADDLAEIHKMVDQVKPELLIIDSIGAAIQSDLNAADGAIRLLTKDIRQLKVTTLILAHQAKHGDPKSPYGSIFFYNYARSVCELRKHQELGEERMEVGIFCHKANIAKLFKPIGLEFAFFEDGTIVERKDVMDLPEMESAMPLIDRMYSLLKKPMTIATLAETLNVAENEIQGILSNRADRFVRLPNGTWAGKTGRYNNQQASPY